MRKAGLGATALATLFFGASASSCARSAETVRPDDARWLSDIRHKWESTLNAKWLAEREKMEAIPMDPVSAAQAGDVKTLELLLARKPDRKTLNGALFMAARSEPLVQGVGIDNGAAQRKADSDYAAVARLLLAKGAGVEARDEYGETPLITAAGYGETGVVRLLLEKGADIEAKGDGGATALIRAACNCPIIDMPDTDDIVRLLLDKGANIEAKDKDGRTALMAAAEWGRSWILKILLDKGANIENLDNRGNTALILAARGSALPMLEAVQTLLEHGANIEARNNNGDTALILATSNDGYEDVKIVKVLLEHGADVHAKNSRGRTALDLVNGQNRAAKAALLKAASAKSRP